MSRVNTRCTATVHVPDPLDTDGVELRNGQLANGRTFFSRLLQNGMQRYTGDADPLTAASLNSYLDRDISTVFRTWAQTVPFGGNRDRTGP